MKTAQMGCKLTGLRLQQNFA